MCSSFPENIPHIIHAIADLRPKTVLDIGMGNGKYGLLIREYFYPRTSPGWPHVETVDGFDVYEGYVKPHHKDCYDKLTFGNALETEFSKYDLYLLIDVLEHWPKDKAHALLEQLTKKGKVLVSTPKIVEPQDDPNNPWEAHVSQWYPGDFEGYGVIQDRSEGPSFIYVLGNT